MKTILRFAMSSSILEDNLQAFEVFLNNVNKGDWVFTLPKNALARKKDNNIIIVKEDHNG